MKGSESTQTLKDGQIVQGRILKLYPKNKALIQIGLNKLIAQLEASLTLGNRYHFQVQTLGDLIYLTVLGDKLKKQSNVNSSELLRQLGLKNTKENVSLVQLLSSNNIPFNPAQLKKALNILEKETNKEQAKHILKRMISVNLPITNSVFEALSSQGKNIFTKQLLILNELLNQNTYPTLLEQNISSRIEQLIGTPLGSVKKIEREILLELSTNRKLFFNALKLAGFIEPDMKYSLWKKDWASSTGRNNSAMTNILDKTTLIANSPLKADSGDIISAFKQLKNDQHVLLEQSIKWQQLYLNKVNQSVMSNKRLTQTVFDQANQFILEKIMPFLPEQQQGQLENLLKNEPQALSKLLKVMQIMQSDHVYTKINHFIINQELTNEFINRPIEQQFVNQIKQFTNMVGLSYENQLLDDKNNHLQNTIKGLLLQLIQQSEGRVHEQLAKVLNIINGLQLQSVNDMNNILYANLQIPAKKLGLTNEIELKFEGKKKNGKIDTDFCRIHFYLELNHLNETVIDMNVQNRSVTLTVYNDSNGLKKITAPFVNHLKEGLRSLNYQLSTVLFKPLKSETIEKKMKRNRTYDTFTQGVDYRI